MKKLNFVIFGAFLLTAVATQALADTTIPWTKEGCESVKGTWITAHPPDDDGCDAAHCNGRNFCMGPQNVHWWGALLWCKSIGRELTDLETACPNGLASSYTCANLTGKIRDCWTTTPAPILRNNSGAKCPSSCSYRISGGITSEYRNSAAVYTGRALCK